MEQVVTDNPFEVFDANEKLLVDLVRAFGTDIFRFFAEVDENAEVL